MPRPKSAPAKAVSVEVAIVPSFFVEEDFVEEAIRAENQRMAYQVNLGNGGYVTRAHSMSDDR